MNHEEEIKRFKKFFSIIKREGSDELMSYLEKEGFFTVSASTKFHDNFKGGLLIHSNNVTKQLLDLVNFHINDYKGFDSQEDLYKSCIVSALLHDVCKVNAYKDNGNDSWSWNPDNEKGHALLSIKRIEQYMKLTDLEKEMIKYHMGYYGTTEFAGARGEYSIKELCLANNNFLVALIHYADMISSRCYEEKK